MAAIYVIAAILGIGLILFSMLGGGDHGDHAGHSADHGDLGHHGPGDILLGLFSTRNLTFFLAAFGATGLLLGWLGVGGIATFGLAITTGLISFAAVHAVFTWLRRSDSAVEVLGDRDLEGSLGRVTWPISPGTKGQVACMLAGRELYITAVLAEGVDGLLGTGQEIIVLSTHNGVAQVMPAGNEMLSNPDRSPSQ